MDELGKFYKVEFYEYQNRTQHAVLLLLFFYFWLFCLIYDVYILATIGGSTQILTYAGCSTSISCSSYAFDSVINISGGLRSNYMI